MSEEAARLLAEIHAARALMRTPAPATARPSTAALWAHALREPGAPVDLAVVRALRGDPDTALRYRTLLAGQAVAHAPQAIAASDGDLAARRVGLFLLEVVPADEDAPPLLVIRGGGDRPVRALEVSLGDDTVRLALPPAAEGAIVIALDPEVPEADRLGQLLRDPATAVFLL
ncbi:hypothetical protein [Methylobacterium fujisawaense]|uniref:hypothetical protein n=1 Tax=Methylobacterium fujisawaense TaxID=107400 RepID=UPI00313E7366